MKNKCIAKMIAITLVSLMSFQLVPTIFADCGNVGGSYTDHLISQCSFCTCINNSPVWWWFASSTNACSGRIYGAPVTIDINCGYNWICYYLPGSSFCVTSNTKWVVHTGNCSAGDCAGSDGPEQGPQTFNCLGNQSCLNPCGSGS